MFNKLKSNMFGESKLKKLENMGFNPIDAREALSSTNGDVERAAELLLLQGPQSTTSSPPNEDTEEEQLRKAMEESLVTQKQNDSGNRSGNMSAAAIRAGQAAARRAQTSSSSRFGANGIALKVKESSRTTPNEKPTTIKTRNNQTTRLSNHHPNVKIPTAMKDKSKKEQILRCTKRLSPHPLAVDTLLRALKAIHKHPTVIKYRTINASNAAYVRIVQGKPGAHDLLQAVNFSFRNNTYHMEDSTLDHALLYLAVSALEAVQSDSIEYKEAKRQLLFNEQVLKIQTGSTFLKDTDVTEEAIKRASFMSKCPSEPSDGAGALLQLKFGEETVLRRRFDGDDVLRDVVNWLGGYGSVIPSMLQTREWSLVDLNRYPITPIDVDLNMDKTLQFIGCWPSGRLEVRPSSEQWQQTNDNTTVEAKQMGSSRGLGAAPSSALV